MSFDQFLSSADAARVSHAFAKLARHDIRNWALTGGLAIELHRLRRGGRPSPRALNDIDFMAASFDSIPRSLADDFLFRHIHPLDPPGKTMLQMIDAETALRIDVFRAYGAEMSRTSTLQLPTAAIRLASFEDLLARTARQALDLTRGVPTPCVHAADFLRLAESCEPAAVEAVWPDHRKPWQPATFQEASQLLHELIPARPNLLIARDYSKDADEVCPRCRSTAAFQFADPRVVLSLLGYV